MVIVRITVSMFKEARKGCSFLDLIYYPVSRPVLPVEVLHFLLPETCRRVFLSTMAKRFFVLESSLIPT